MRQVSWTTGKLNPEAAGLVLLYRHSDIHGIISEDALEHRLGDVGWGKDLEPVGKVVHVPQVDQLFILAASQTMIKNGSPIGQQRLVISAD